MQRFVTLILILLVAGSALALDRADMPSNPAAFNNDAASPALPEGQDVTIFQMRDTTVYLNSGDFLALLEPGYYFDNFGWLDWGTIGGDLSYQFGPVNGYSFTASAPNGLYSIPGALSTNSAYETLTLDFDGLPVFAVGGDFYATDFDGVPITATVTLLLSDGTTVDLDSPARFAGFVSDVAITQLTVSTPNTGTSAWVTLDNFYVGQTGTVAAELTTFGGIKALFD